MGQLMYLKEYLTGLLTIGLTSNYSIFIEYCNNNNLPILSLNKFIDLEFDLMIVLRDVPIVCPYVSYMRYKELDFIGINKLPPLTTQVKNLTTTMADFMFSGFELVTEKEQKQRFDMCKSCMYVTEGFRCSVCGCFMRYKSKIKAAVCPKGNW